MEPPEQQPPAEEATPRTPDARPRRRRWLLYALAFVTAVFAALVVTFFTVDLGPYVKERAEVEATKWLDRRMTIGRISARVRPGVFEFHDVVIQGLTPADAPFLTAKRITVSLPWWTAFSRRLVIESIEMTDWKMVIESWDGGRHNFPRFKGPDRPPRDPNQPRNFTTTLQHVLASRGHVTYVDHGTPWRIVAPNMRVLMFRRELRDDYGGTASFSNGRISIQTYEEFGARMQSRFSLKGPLLHFDRIDLATDGAQSVLEGELQTNNWPEQIYRIRSRIDIATQKHIFFNREPFDATGEAEFEGTFHYFKGGRELKGSWRTPVAHVKIAGNTWRFPQLRGDVLWVPDRLEVTNARSALYGGTADFDYRLLSLDQKSGPRRAIWDVAYQQVDLAQLTDFLELQGIRLAGRATGRNRLEWPLGGWSMLRGHGEVRVQPPPGVTPMGRELKPEQVALQASFGEEAGPFNPRAPLGYVPIAGHIVYRLDPEWITLGESWVATRRTYVEFTGRTAYYKRSRIPFHVTSLDWQEADRVFAGILTAFGSPTGAVPVGGHGEFTGVMLGAFNDPRIEGTFTGDRMRAWDVVWGRGSADVVIEDSYVHVSRSTLSRPDAEIEATGRFSLGYPRRDGGEEIDARVLLRRWPMVDLRHAFELDDWPVDGLVSGDYVIKGHYETPVGEGTLLVEDGVAYGETFDRATAALKFEGNGVRLTKFEVQKSTGRMSGAAWVGWAGDYSFSADGERIPVESLKMLEFPRAPLSGILRFKASGAGMFEEPRYDVTLNIIDLFAGDEGIGQLTGHLGLRGELLTLDFEAASPRLAVSGAGRIAMTDEMDAELTLRFNNSSLDPYLRFFEPRLSPFTHAVAGGTVRVTGELANPEQLIVEARVEDLDLTLFDYQLENDGVIELALNRNVVEIGRFRLRGEGTNLQMDGEVNLTEETIDVNATGDANLGILQGFFRNLRSSGRATLRAGVTGTLERPVFTGKASIADGRLRYFQMPRSLDSINGTITFDSTGIRLDAVAPPDQPLTARLGGGLVTFGGRIAMNGFTPGELSLTALGERMHLNYPEGFRSEIDADLSLRGTIESPFLTGNVTVRSARYDRRFETTPNLFTFGSGTTVPLGAPATTTTVPLRFDIRIDAPHSLHIDNNVARMLASADLRLEGTYDRPILTGRAEIERGDLVFEGNRYRITRGTVDFANPLRIEPYFDIEAETRVRVAEQTYRLTVGLIGTTSRMVPTLMSDPPLPATDIIALMFGQTRDLTNAELRTISGTAQSEQELLRELSYRILSAPIAAPVGRVVEEVLGSRTTVQITPMFGTETDLFAPSARLVIGQRLSSRAYLTFARALGNASREQIIVLEYDQNDRIGWIITQNGDRTFAIDFRVRHVF
ncbi:MAG TPA: translocation/assembly module TamB domain-containing protein [Vicinamibacterales bacterium]|nr:translocation/assembly module TamB domain-containing protein [Vicinamibacterales bacterium]